MLTTWAADSGNKWSVDEGVRDDLQSTEKLDKRPMSIVLRIRIIARSSGMQIVDFFAVVS